MFDDDRPKKPTTHEIGTPLDALSVDELEARIQLLEAEIARLRSSIEAKRQHHSAAASLFKL